MPSVASIELESRLITAREYSGRMKKMPLTMKAASVPVAAIKTIFQRLCMSTTPRGENFLMHATISQLIHLNSRWFGAGGCADWARRAVTYSLSGKCSRHQKLFWPFTGSWPSTPQTLHPGSLQ